MKTMRCVLSFFLCGLLACPAYSSTERDAAIDAQVFAPVVDSSTSDGKASVYHLDGKAMITPKGNPQERALKVGDQIGIGDAVYTERGASLSISFDNRKQNAVRIPAETKATFTSIEPTDIKLDDGTIFSVVNGLAKGSTWKVTTPSAVAAVRGTVFETTYHADTKEFFAATLEVADDGKTSAIEIESLVGEGMAEIVEGKEISFKEGETPSQERVQDFTSEKMAEVQKFNQDVSMERQKSEDSSNNHGGGNGPGGPNGPGSGSGPANGGTTNPNGPQNPNGPGVPFTALGGMNSTGGSNFAGQMNAPGNPNSSLGLGGLGGIIGTAGGPPGGGPNAGGGFLGGGPEGGGPPGGSVNVGGPNGGSGVPLDGPGGFNGPGGPGFTGGPNGPGFDGPGGFGGPNNGPGSGHFIDPTLAGTIIQNNQPPAGGGCVNGMLTTTNGTTTSC